MRNLYLFRPPILRPIVTFAIILLFSGMQTIIAQNVLSIKPIGGENAVSGICVIDIETGDVVAAHQSEHFFIPASTQKLITATTLLLCYTPGHRLSTQVYHDGKISPRGRLHGNLYIRGCGDPSLGSQYSDVSPDTFIREVVKAVKSAGKRSISGQVIADDRAIPDNPVVSKWLWEDVGNYYAAGCYGINYADNRFAATFRTGEPGSRPTLLEITPKIKNLRIYDYLSTNRSGRDSAYIYGAPYEYTRRIYGSLPANRDRFTIKGDLPDPPHHLARQLTETLRRSGIKVQHEATTARILHETGKALAPYDPGKPVLLTYYSPALVDLLRHTLIESDNLYAESLLRQVELASHPTATLLGSIEAMKNIWKEKGFPIDDAILYDGSGLSPLNRITPLMMCRLLAYVAGNGETGNILFDLLPRPGEGTLKRFMDDSELATSFRLKSGSMTGVQCYAGYYKGKRTYAVVVMVNHFSSPRARVQKEVADTLTRLFYSLEKPADKKTTSTQKI